MTTVAINYGAAEGRGHSSKLRKAIKKAGYRVITDVAKADIIMAHSAGGLLLPGNSRAKLILLVGFPHWPNKSVWRSVSEKIAADKKALTKGRFKKLFLNTYYGLTRPWRLAHLWKIWQNKQFRFPEPPVYVLVRGDQDTFMHPLESLALANEKGWHFETIAGQHDDLWLKPEPYIKLMKKYDELLAKADR